MLKSIFIFVGLFALAFLVSTVIGVATTLYIGKAVGVFTVGFIWIVTLAGFALVAAAKRHPYYAAGFAIPALLIAWANLVGGQL